MPTKPTPTDAEIDALIAQHWPAFATAGAIPLTWLRNAFREGLACWGAQPAPAASQVPGDEALVRQMLTALCKCEPHIDADDQWIVRRAAINAANDWLMQRITKGA